MEIIIGFIVEDRPGIIQKLSNVVSDSGGNWLESSMTSLGGYFSGTVLVELDDDDAGLRDALASLDEFTITLHPPLKGTEDGSGHLMQINVLGPDRPGVLKEVANELAARQINILEMETQVRPAPMTGEPLFEADACIEVPDATDMDQLTQQLNLIGDALGVDVLLEDIAQD